MSKKGYKRLQPLVKTYNVIPECAFIVNQKSKNKIYKLWIVDYRIPVQQIAIFKSKKINRNMNRKRWL